MFRFEPRHDDNAVFLQIRAHGGEEGPIRARYMPATVLI